MYVVVPTLIRSLHFLEPSWELWTEGHWLPVTLPTGNLYIVYLCFVCVCLVFKRWESFTISNRGCLSRSKNRKELSGRRSRPQVLLEKSRYQGNHWIHLSFTRFEKKLADLSMHHYGILYPLALNVYRWGGWEAGGGPGGGDRAVKTACMSIVFYQASDGVKLYLYYLFYVRVKLNSWHRNIEALFKQTGCSLVCFLSFKLLILTDVL